jgi:hypothetical protein
MTPAPYPPAAANDTGQGDPLSFADLEFITAMDGWRAWDFASGCVGMARIQLGTPTTVALLRKLADILEAG